MQHDTFGTWFQHFNWQKMLRATLEILWVIRQGSALTTMRLPHKTIFCHIKHTVYLVYSNLWTVNKTVAVSCHQRRFMYNKLIILMTPALLRKITSNAFFPTVNTYENVVTSSFISNDTNKHLCTNQYSQLTIFLFSNHSHCTQDFLDFTAATHLSTVPL